MKWMRRHTAPIHHPRGQRDGRARRQPLHRHRHLLQHRHRARGLRAGPGGTGDGGRHGLLVVAGGDAPSGDGASAGRVGSRARRRRPYHPVRAAAGASGERRDAVAGRAVRDVRCGRERLRARRRLRHRRAQAARRGASRRGPHLGRDPRHRAQPGRGEPGPDGTEPAGAGEVHPGGARAGRHRARPGGLPGSARHRDSGRRPHRAGGDGCRVPPRTRSGAAPADRLGEDQHRTPGIGGGRREPRQGRARDAGGGDSAAAGLPGPESAHRLGPTSGTGDRAADGLAARSRPAAAGGGQCVRDIGGERACRGGGVRHARRRLLPRRGCPRTRAAGHHPPPGGGGGFGRGNGRAGAGGGARRADDAPPSAIRKVARSASRPGRSIPVVARRAGRRGVPGWRGISGKCGIAGRHGVHGRYRAPGMRRAPRRRGPPGKRGVRSAALGHGVDVRRGTESLQPPGRCGVQRWGVATRGAEGARRHGRSTRAAGGDEGRVRVRGRGWPMGRHGRGAVRERAGGSARCWIVATR